MTTEMTNKVWKLAKKSLLGEKPERKTGSIEVSISLGYTYIKIASYYRNKSCSIVITVPFDDDNIILHVLPQIQVIAFYSYHKSLL